ncbi:MAG: hypothetical protein HY327_06205 [Chloroflexi bacterium]|nr:hypothetical protein [Chloroflexota bacterium]
MITIQIDGQNFPLPDEIAAKDELLKAALAPFVPWIANAQIDRKEENGSVVVSVVKRADWKGNGRAVVAALVASPAEMNPAVALWMQMQAKLDTSDPATILALEPTITAAIEAGDQDIASVHQALTRLVECAPTSAQRIPQGF